MPQNLSHGRWEKALQLHHETQSFDSLEDARCDFTAKPTWAGKTNHKSMVSSVLYLCECLPKPFSAGICSEDTAGECEYKHACIIIIIVIIIIIITMITMIIMIIMIMIMIIIITIIIIIIIIIITTMIMIYIYVINI
jgi:ABC-type multidrug transport system fused ATPase/permease subunit